MLLQCRLFGCGICVRRDTAQAFSCHLQILWLDAVRAAGRMASVRVQFRATCRRWPAPSRSPAQEVSHASSLLARRRYRMCGGHDVRRRGRVCAGGFDAEGTARQGDLLRREPVTSTRNQSCATSCHRAGCRMDWVRPDSDINAAAARSTQGRSPAPSAIGSRPARRTPRRAQSCRWTGRGCSSAGTSGTAGPLAKRSATPPPSRRRARS